VFKNNLKIFSEHSVGQNIAWFGCRVFYDDILDQISEKNFILRKSIAWPKLQDFGQTKNFGLIWQKKKCLTCKYTFSEKIGN
jgi:hypothetical protein